MKSKYKVIIFDFDNTLCNINLFRKGVKLRHINECDKTVIIDNKYVNVYTLFNDYDLLVELFNKLKQQNVKLCIASFACINIVNKILKIAFPGIFDYVITSDNIDDEANTLVLKIFRHTIDILCPRFYGKNIMIKTIMNKFNIDNPSEIFFFDDDYSNLVCATNYIKVHGYNNNTNGINAQMFKKLVFTNDDLNGGSQKQYIKYVHKIKKK